MYIYSTFKKQNKQYVKYLCQAHSKLIVSPLLLFSSTSVDVNLLSVHITVLWHYMHAYNSFRYNKIKLYTYIYSARIYTYT